MSSIIALSVSFILVIFISFFWLEFIREDKERKVGEGKGGCFQE